MQTSKHHPELTEGRGKCSVPMWHGGPTCPGIEIEPGVYSGCRPLPSGGKDCPVCCDLEPSEISQGLTPIPDGYAER